MKNILDLEYLLKNGFYHPKTKDNIENKDYINYWLKESDIWLSIEVCKLKDIELIDILKILDKLIIETLNENN